MSGRKKSGTRRDGLESKIASVNKLESITPSNSNNTARPLSIDKGHKAGAGTTIKIGGRITEKSIQNSNNRRLKEISKALKQAEKVTTTLPRFSRGNKTLQAVKSHIASKPESRPEAQDKKVMGGGRMKVKYQESQGFSPTLTKSINLDGSTASESSVVKALKKPISSSASSKSAAISQKRSPVLHGSRSDTMPARISLSLM